MKNSDHAEGARCPAVTGTRAGRVSGTPSHTMNANAKGVAPSPMNSHWNEMLASTPPSASPIESEIDDPVDEAVSPHAIGRRHEIGDRRLHARPVHLGDQNERAAAINEGPRPDHPERAGQTSGHGVKERARVVQLASFNHALYASKLNGRPRNSSTSFAAGFEPPGASTVLR